MDSTSSGTLPTVNAALQRLRWRDAHNIWLRMAMVIAVATLVIAAGLLAAGIHAFATVLGVCVLALVAAWLVAWQQTGSRQLLYLHAIDQQLGNQDLVASYATLPPSAFRSALERTLDASLTDEVTRKAVQSIASSYPQRATAMCLVSLALGALPFVSSPGKKAFTHDGSHDGPVVAAADSTDQPQALSPEAEPQSGSSAPEPASTPSEASQESAASESGEDSSDTQPSEGAQEKAPQASGETTPDTSNGDAQTGESVPGEKGQGSSGSQPNAAAHPSALRSTGSKTEGKPSKSDGASPKVMEPEEENLIEILRPWEQRRSSASPDEQPQGSAPNLGRDQVQQAPNTNQPGNSGLPNPADAEGGQTSAANTPRDDSVIEKPATRDVRVNLEDQAGESRSVEVTRRVLDLSGSKASGDATGARVPEREAQQPAQGSAQQASMTTSEAQWAKNWGSKTKAGNE